MEPAYRGVLDLLGEDLLQRDFLGDLHFGDFRRGDRFGDRFEDRFEVRFEVRFEGMC